MGMFDWIDWFECEVEIGIIFFFFFFFLRDGRNSKCEVMGKTCSETVTKNLSDLP